MVTRVNTLAGFSAVYSNFCRTNIKKTHKNPSIVENRIDCFVAFDVQHLREYTAKVFTLHNIISVTAAGLESRTHKRLVLDERDGRIILDVRNQI